MGHVQCFLCSKHIIIVFEKVKKDKGRMVWPGSLLVLGLTLMGPIADCVEPMAQEFMTIDTDLGKIRGLVKSARNGKPFEAFLGVPYAQPPLGDLRWEAPEPADTWEGVLD